MGETDSGGDRLWGDRQCRRLTVGETDSGGDRLWGD